MNDDMRRLRRAGASMIAALATAAFAFAAGCDRAAPPAPDVDATSRPSAATSPGAPDDATTRAAAPVRVVFLGDSLTAGYGLEATQAFPALLEQQLLAERWDVTVVNAGVSGDTTAGGLRRLDWILRQRPDVLVVCLGGNDGLRNLDVGASADNLRQIIARARAARVEVLLLGMMIPTNYGPEYRAQFASIFPTLAREAGVPVVPFALEGVGGVAELNQPDGIHPTAQGQQRVAANVIAPLRDLVAASAATRAAR